MKLTSTLFADSSAGKFGGALSLAFSSSNPADYNPATGFWNFSGAALTQDYSVGSAQVRVQAAIKTDPSPGSLLLDSPYIQVTAPGASFGGLLSWQSPGSIVPGTPFFGVQHCLLNQVNDGVSFHFGMNFVWDWDGAQGYGYGRWWAYWSPVVAAPSGAKVSVGVR